MNRDGFGPPITFCVFRLVRILGYGSVRLAPCECASPKEDTISDAQMDWPEGAVSRPLRRAAYQPSNRAP
jgi:hypothetical protein